jgi:hypothetical protein
MQSASGTPALGNEALLRTRVHLNSNEDQLRLFEYDNYLRGGWGVPKMVM